MKPPVWGIALAYWLHILATVVWIGGLSALTLLVLPAARKTLNDAAFAALVDGIQSRLDRLGWFCLVVLGGTGLIQMSANPNYRGFLAIDNLWAGAILSKHLLILLMVAVSAFLTWGVLPGLRRSLLRLEAARDNPQRVQEARAASQASTRLLRLNLALSIFVLALTALARAS